MSASEQILQRLPQAEFTLSVRTENTPAVRVGGGRAAAAAEGTDQAFSASEICRLSLAKLNGKLFQRVQRFGDRTAA